MLVVRLSLGVSSGPVIRKRVKLEVVFVGVRRGLERHVRRFCASAQDVQDILQETWLRVYQRTQGAPLDRDESAALLYVTARNLAISRYRHQRVVNRNAAALRIDELDRREIETVESEAEQEQEFQQLLRCLNELPPKCREVFMLRMIEGLSQPQIAERLGISLGTVEKHVARGLRQCRETLLGLRT